MDVMHVIVLHVFWFYFWLVFFKMFLTNYINEKYRHNYKFSLYKGFLLYKCITWLSWALFLKYIHYESWKLTKVPQKCLKIKPFLYHCCLCYRKCLKPQFSRSGRWGGGASSPATHRQEAARRSVTTTNPNVCLHRHFPEVCRSVYTVWEFKKSSPVIILKCTYQLFALWGWVHVWYFYAQVFQR